MVASMLCHSLSQNLAELLPACHLTRWLSIEKIALTFTLHPAAMKELDDIGNHVPDPRHIQIGRLKGSPL
jgi:hypothetical protein